MFKKFAQLVAGKAIKSVKPNVPTTKTQKKIRDLKIGNQKLKSSKAKLDQTIFEFKNKQPITFKTNKGKSESNREAYKRIQKDNTKAIKGMIDKAFEKKANGGRIGRKFGGPMKKKTNVEKIRETFAPKNKNLKPVDKKKNPGLAKLPTKVRNNMGYMKSGGRAGFMGGGASETTREKEKFQLDKNISKVKEKMKGLKLTKTQEEQLKDRSRKIGSNVYRKKP